MSYWTGHQYWVADDGSYGVGNIACFDHDVLTDEQWRTVSDLSDNDRYYYVVAVLNGADTAEWEGAESDCEHEWGVEATNDNFCVFCGADYKEAE
jgi:intein/homing endonuclease